MSPSSTFAVCFALTLTSCSDQPPSDRAASRDAEAPVPDAAPALPSVSAFCGADVDWKGPVTTHAELTALLAALPAPVSLPCMLAALPRPIAVVGSKNVVSAQPAAGPNDPRVFVQPPNGLILSITLAGETSTHLETAESVPDVPGYSIKGDLTFPLARIAERDFFADIVNAKYSGTLCGGCHAGEYEARKVDGMPAFASRALAAPRKQQVTLARLRELSAACEPTDVGDRCQMLRALLRDPQAVTEMIWSQATGTLF